MKNEEITDKYYQMAVAGLNEKILDDKDDWYNYVINLPTRLQIVYTVIIFHQQVFNGGLHQYFYNPYGQFAYLTVEFLKVINAFKIANILERALNNVNSEQLDVIDFRTKIYFREIERIIDFDEKLCESLDLLDNEYDNVDEDLEQLLVDYLIEIDII